MTEGEATGLESTSTNSDDVGGMGSVLVVVRSSTSVVVRTIDFPPEPDQTDPTWADDDVVVVVVFHHPQIKTIIIQVVHPAV